MSRRAVPRLSPARASEIARALRPHALTDELDLAIAQALDTYAGRQDQVAWHQQRDAVHRMLKAARDLDTAMHRADAAFDVSAWTPSEKKTKFISSAWHQHVAPLTDLIASLDPWLKRHAHAPRRRRGNPHQGRYELRVAVLGALDDHGISVTPRGSRGPAARTLTVVLAAADRLDHRIPRGRVDGIKAQDWAIWVGELRAVNALVARGRR